MIPDISLAKFMHDLICAVGCVASEFDAVFADDDVDNARFVPAVEVLRLVGKGAEQMPVRVENFLADFASVCAVLYLPVSALSASV